MKDFNLKEADILNAGLTIQSINFISENKQVADNYDTVRNIQHLQKMLESKKIQEQAKQKSELI